jgi:murein DD-endopeptidase MepM/ murein hydrolase activator NlpD
MARGSSDGIRRGPGRKRFHGQQGRSIKLLAALLLFPALAWAEPPQNFIAPASAGQGEYIRFTFITDPLAQKLSLKFLEKVTPCFSEPVQEGRKFVWECLAAVPADAPAGPQAFEIYPLEATAGRIQIEERPFPVETLTLTKEKKDLLKDSEDKDAEIKFIRAQLATASPKRLWRGEFIKPTNGKVESLFGEKRILDGKLRPNYYHRGLDLGAPHGSPLRATQAGVVLAARAFTEEGNMIMLDHGRGIISLYMHCSKMLVREGQKIKAGQIIGKVGDTGVASTPHVHWGIYVNGVPIDPLFWLGHLPPQP